ncbi:cell wall / vacuolar inhibitor of fructosidase 1-like [Neltuma alba]|uniref:cell wall / vacuolar inhibitor of fructosidase 1-like n=1 Tax=Neltuma alba TaxID=207710 RepID=UPI0010A2E2DA|nr:cell wall / vacuolar inhibitor of fructosidase 1-like [Prosopis alba]XP_028760161.1 cell wall / vacuolar inhibitor of fructosidase 1-like [Prosopis alba]
MTNFKLLPLLLFFYVLSATSSSFNDANLIQQTCKHTPNQALCLQYLKSDPRSSDADISGLALIMVDAMKAKAKQALAKIRQELQRRSHSDREKQALRSCADQYRAVLEADVPEAIAALQKGDPKFAEDGANDAALEANSCESGFSSGKSPLTPENNALHDIAQVTAAIVRNLL